MKDVKNRIVQHPNRYKLTQVSGDVYDLSPEAGTITEVGTIVNRSLLMEMQGFSDNETLFNADGSITETNADLDTKVTVFNSDGSITETFTSNGISIAKKTTFNADGSISEVMI